MLHPHLFTSTEAAGDRRFAAAQALDERLGLSRVDDRLRRLAQQALLPGTLGSHLRQSYAERVNQYATKLRALPFLPPPPSITEGAFTLGRANGYLFRLTNDELLRHLLIAGPSGAGKTTFLQHVVLQARALGIHVVVPDYKGDLQWQAAIDDDYVIVHPDMPLNILEHDTKFGRESFIDLVVQLLARSYYGGEHLRQVAQESLERAYERFGTPSVVDWMHIAKSMISPKDTYQRRDAYAGLVHRLQRLIMLFPGMTSTRHGIAHNILANRSIYLGAPHHNDTYDYLGALFVLLVHQAAVVQQDRNTLRRLLLLDEGLLSFGATSRIDGPVLLPWIPLFREHGTAVLLSTAHLGGIHETLRTNMYTTIVLPLTNATDASLAARTLGLSGAQAEYLLRLKVGQAIVRTGKCETPFVITFPPATMDKTVDPTAWQAAIQRTNKLAPSNHITTPRTTTTPPTTTNPASATPPVIAHNTPPATSATAIAYNNQTTEIALNAPTASRAQVIASNATPPVVATPALPVALSTAEHALLRATEKLAIPTSTVAYRAASLSLQSGDSAAKHCEHLGLLTRDPITAHGRRGGNAIALQLTNAGYERLDAKPPHRLRAGSSAQHTYLVMNLAKLIPEARIEATLGGQGGKSMDILIRLTNKHERLLRALDNNADAFTSNRPSLVPGDLVAIEVETTADTIVNNIAKNLAAGIAHNITAVMPKALPTAKKTILKDIRNEQLPRVLLINVFSLLEGLQEKQP